MYVLSANSQNMQGEGIDSLCLEEPFSNASSGICYLEASFAFWGKSRPDIQESGRQSCRSLRGFLTVWLVAAVISPSVKEPKIKSEFSVVLDTTDSDESSYSDGLLYQDLGRSFSNIPFLQITSAVRWGTKARDGKWLACGVDLCAEEYMVENEQNSILKVQYICLLF